MAVKIISWNIQKFGAFGKLKTGPDDAPWVNGTLAAIACIVNSYNADILVIQEFRQAGAQNLPALQKFLEASGDTWSFDYVKGAFSQTKGSLIKGSANLEYTGKANSEGYAVLWKDGLLAAFTDVKMSTGQNGVGSKPGYINLVLAGSAPRYDFFAEVEIFADGKGYGNDTRFPVPGSRKVVFDLFTPDINKNVLRFENARRPCVIKVVSPQDGTVPVLIYHAPASAPASLYGSWACALAAQVGADSTTNVVLGGDFNLTTQSQFNTMLTLYNGLKLNNGTASKTRGNEFGFTRSQIQYQQPFVTPVSLVDDDSIYEHPRDVMFYRNTIKKPTSGVIDVVYDLQVSANAMTKAVINNSYVRTAISGVQGATDKDYQFPDVVLQDKDLMSAITAPFYGRSKAFGSTLAAAVFYRCFVSDHLPVYCQLG